LNPSSLKRALQANKAIISIKQYAYEKKYTISHGLDGPDPYSTTDFGTEEILHKLIATDRNKHDHIDNSASKTKINQSQVGSSISKIDIKDSLAKKTRVTSGKEKSLRSPKVDSSSPYKNENMKPSSMSMIPTNYQLIDKHSITTL
jgi:hypothetical protein